MSATRFTPASRSLWIPPVAWTNSSSAWPRRRPPRPRPPPPPPRRRKRSSGFPALPPAAASSLCGRIFFSRMDLRPHIEKFSHRLAEVEAALSDPKVFANNLRFQQLSKEEIARLGTEEKRLALEVQRGLVPPDPADSRNTIIEIRAGAGGSESALFAADLYRMYSRYAESQGWELETLDSSPSDLGGFKEIIFSVSGRDVFKRLKYESGVHRVQRVPATEAQGRIHTSTTTVAVLPEAE